jgi:hypothetical protein
MRLAANKILVAAKREYPKWLERDWVELAMIIRATSQNHGLTISHLQGSKKIVMALLQLEEIILKTRVILKWD